LHHYPFNLLIKIFIYPHPTQKINNLITDYLTKIETELKQKPVDRHNELIKKIAHWIAEEVKGGNSARLNFICTHNSRRSQFAQAWCILVQDYLGLKMAEAYSGGTEVTACNERTVYALERAGCTVKSDGTHNPVYTVRATDMNTEIRLWSKVYDDEANPSGRFAAIMTCDHADANCPFIPGAAIRVPLTYTDPKFADDTDAENSAYDETCKIVASDMIRIFREAEELASKA
jgi:arsenate reductase (thioredoxin)